MSLLITSETLYEAPNGAPSTRRTIGVGEPITFSTRVNAEWDVPGMRITRRSRQQTVQFTRPGRHRVVARGGGDEGTLTIRVVTPSTHVRKIRDVPVQQGYVGAWMKLQFTLTPLGVSFAGLGYRELECDATSVWGYFQTHREHLGNVFHHDPRPDPSAPEWATVNMDNVVEPHDNAAFQMHVPRLNWPITNGGFRWDIPREYKIGDEPFPFPQPMPQVIRIDPQGGTCSGTPYRGTVTIWKGGQQVIVEGYR